MWTGNNPVGRQRPPPTRPAELRLRLERSRGAQVRRLRRRAARAVKALRRYARTFAVARPRALLCEGRLHSHMGNPRRATRAWTRSLEDARALDLPYDAAWALYELGHHATSATDRTASLAEAHTAFAQLVSSSTPGDPDPTEALRLCLCRCAAARRRPSRPPPRWSVGTRRSPATPAAPTSPSLRRSRH